ncbi:uncharacterized protein [Nicotiana sylvestris]|uniref:Uncharacterized protein isoform X1 n=1 Tax=Nicotiana tabacum TaxID=4097 RepID=A0A1S3ZIH1_TOBAC|nr:PREDICTED: uncharacterized protein LOC107787133 isoform X1 [Nicotiana tabacum]
MIGLNPNGSNYKNRLSSSLPRLLLGLWIASKPWACSLLLFYVHLVSNGAWYPYGAIKNIDGEGILTDISCSWMASDNGRAFFKHWQFEYINLKEEETEKKKY